MREMTITDLQNTFVASVNYLNFQKQSIYL